MVSAARKWQALSLRPDSKHPSLTEAALNHGAYARFSASRQPDDGVACMGVEITKNTWNDES